MDVQVAYRCVDVWRWRGRCMDASVRRRKWTEAREKTYILGFVRSQSLFKRLADKSVSFQDKNKVNRQQVEARTKWICVRFILVPKTSGE